MVDKQKVEQAVRLLLEGIGEDTEREGLKETPARIARMYEELMAGMDEDAAVHLSKTFTSQNTGIVLEKDITFYSICEHHLMPFYGKAHIAYIPSNNKIIGLSKFARIVDNFAKKPQVQERLTSDIADFLEENLQPKGVAVIMEAEHMCMSIRGAKASGSQTQTSALRGIIKKDARTRAEVLSLLMK